MAVDLHQPQLTGSQLRSLQPTTLPTQNEYDESSSEIDVLLKYVGHKFSQLFNSHTCSIPSQPFCVSCAYAVERHVEHSL